MVENWQKAGNALLSLQNKNTMTRSLSILLILSVFLLFSCSKPEHNTPDDDILWYPQPASVWEEALPIGNGRIGAMVFGDPVTDHLQLNDDSLWPADLGWEAPDGRPEDLQQIRELLLEGRNAEADALFVEKFSNKSVVRSHQTLGDLYIDLNHSDITDYRRDLNIGNATAGVSYKTGGYPVSGTYFTSHPHQAIIIRYTSEAPDGLNGTLRLSRPEDNGHPTVSSYIDDYGHLVMTGEVTQWGGRFRSEEAPIDHGVMFETVLKVRNSGGTVVAYDDHLELRNVKEATLILVSNSSWYHVDYSGQNSKELQALQNISYDDLLNAHIQDFKGLYDRVDLELADHSLDSIPTDQRLERIKAGQLDPGLEALLFQFGRYLLISSSRPGTNPANLQGLWNKHIQAPWNADYHLNINLQMNYWPANMTGLSDLNAPLFDYVDRLIENGKQVAHDNFGCRGSFLPHATDLLAPAWLRAATAYWGCSVGAAGWMLQHYMQHFEYTGDTTFLRERTYPALTEVAQFYSDWIIEDPRDGTLISAPSTSPENQFIAPNGDTVATCLGSAMDQQVIAEVFRNYVRTCEMLGLENELLSTIRVQQKRLRPGFVLGSDGRILEWDREYRELEPGHRHMSHLYGFHPGTAVTVNGSPDIFKAVRETLDYRLANGGAGTGWSRAWLINCSARLLDGAMAQEHIQQLLRKSIMVNLFDSHPPFQIDGNFGYSAGIAEMLVQSHEENTIRILPALPPSWDKGKAIGLNARGGLTIDVYWDNHTLNHMIIHSDFDRDFNLLYEGKVIPVKIKAGSSFDYQSS